MADYNVNMKQWNGTSFDNVLPLAYNAKQLEGQSLAEVKQWVQDNNLLLYTGQYMGTGTYGASHPTSIKFPFEPIIIFTPLSYESVTDAGFYVFTSALSNNFVAKNWLGTGRNIFGKISNDRKTFSWYDSADYIQQANSNGVIYSYAAIGGYDMGGQNSSRRYIYHHIQ